jgi:hypothetical protein
MHILDSTRYRLRVWGRWAQGGLRGYPTMCAFLQIVHAQDVGIPPQDILETESAVNRAERHYRIVLVKEFCHRGARRQKAFELDLPKTTYERRLDEAMWVVHTELDTWAKNTVERRNMPVGVKA